MHFHFDILKHVQCDNTVRENDRGSSRLMVSYWIQLKGGKISRYLRVVCLVSGSGMIYGNVQIVCWQLSARLPICHGAGPRG